MTISTKRPVYNSFVVNIFPIYHWFSGHVNFVGLPGLQYRQREWCQWLQENNIMVSYIFYIVSQTRKVKEYGHVRRALQYVYGNTVVVIHCEFDMQYSI